MSQEHLTQNWGGGGEEGAQTKSTMISSKVAYQPRYLEESWRKNPIHMGERVAG